MGWEGERHTQKPVQRPGTYVLSILHQAVVQPPFEAVMQQADTSGKPRMDNKPEIKGWKTGNTVCLLHVGLDP